jgi:hypothetical protein
MKAKVWRRDRESNPARRICNPLHNRFAIAPRGSFWHTATSVRTVADAVPETKKGSQASLLASNLERETSLELATSTLARLRSTN